MGNEIFIANGITEAEKVRLARLARGLRQVDVCCMAQVNIVEIVALEKGRFIREKRKNQILRVLGLLDDDQAEADHAES